MTPQYKATILGCGSSGGVPRIGNDWGACDPQNPKNRRRRCSLLLEQGQADAQTQVLIDTGPDMREQLLSVGVSDLAGVVYTHDHADHVHGIDDLRALAIQNKRRIDVYFDKDCGARISNRFQYCFTASEGSVYPPILNASKFEIGALLSIKGEGGVMQLQTFRQLHGDIESVGYRLGGLAYSSDLHDLPEDALPALEGLEIWIVDALRYTSHVTHFSVERALDWIERIKPKRAILTNMHVSLDYETLKNELPSYVEPAYDGMTLAF